MPVVVPFHSPAIFLVFAINILASPLVGVARDFYVFPGCLRLHNFKDRVAVIIIAIIINRPFKSSIIFKLEEDFWVKIPVVSLMNFNFIIGS